MSSTPQESFLALMVALHAVVDHRLGVQLRQIGREKIKGKEPHPDLLINADRSQYLRDGAQEAIARVKDVAVAYRDYRDLEALDMEDLPEARVNELADKFSGSRNPQQAALGQLMVSIARLDIDA